MISSNFNGLSQYDKLINPSYQSSACGPVTAFTLLSYLLPTTFTLSANDLYKLLGSTKIGLFKWKFIRNLRKILGKDWRIANCGLEELKFQIDNGLPVAAKFDKWFSFNWRGTYEFDYHWVPVIGYEHRSEGVYLIVHDNGGRNRESKIRYVSYKQNESILSFVKIEPIVKVKK